MNLDDLDLDLLRTLHTRLAVPSGPGAPRELLREAGVGFHVEVNRSDDELTPLPMPPPKEDLDRPLRKSAGGAPVMVMKFADVKVA